MTPEDTDEQRETIVVKRGKGRSTRGKKSAATTRSSRGKKNEAVAEDVAEEADVESLPKGRRSRRKRKISEEKPKTESKNEAESSIVKGDVENMETENKEEKLNLSGDEEDNDMLKLQMSAVDSPETDDFIRKKKPVLETKRPARRGKKATTEELESDDESETTNVEVEKRLEPRAKRSVSTKSTRKARGKKNQDFPEVDNDENVTESVSKQGEMIDSNKDGQTLGNQKDSMVKSTKKGRSKKSQGVTEVDSNENIPEDVAKQDEMVEKKKGKNTQGQQKDSVEKPAESVEQELPDVMTPVVNTRISRGGKKGKQTSTKKSRNGASGNAVQNLEQVQDKNEMDEPDNNVDETKMKEPKTPARGRARKRKSSENSNETTQQKKGTAKKSRKNTTTEENSETKDETHHGRETTASPQDDIKFESPELTPRSLSKRSSSTASTSSTSSVSRSARKGKKQEKEDSEGSVDHSSNVKIIFTGLQDNAFVKAKKIVQTLGGKVVERLEDCTHLVTDKVRRTVKLLCAVSRGIPVVDMSWLDASKKSKSFVDSSSFILEDKEAQKKFNFSMERSLELAQNAGLLDGYKIHVTPNVRPPPDDMKEIIKSAKGEIVSKMPTSRDNDVIVLSCDEDKELCEKAHVEKLYTAELLLTGILRHKLDLDQNKLTFSTTSDINSDRNTPVKSKGRRRR